MSRHARQLTLRGFDPRLARALERTAEQEGISLNKAALRLMRRGAGIDERAPAATIGDSLDDLIGTWSKRDGQRLLKTIESCRQIDEDLWR